MTHLTQISKKLKSDLYVGALLSFICLCVLGVPLGLNKAHEQTQPNRYKGFLDVRVMEPNDAQYILGVKFKSGYSKSVYFKLRPYNGKASIETFRPIYQQNNGEDKRSFNMTHKYYFSMRIRENDHKSYAATVKLFRRKKDKIDINKPYRFNPKDFKLIETQPVKGQFNIDNEYLFIDSGELKFYVKLNFDLLFTRQEVIERFNKVKNTN
jgi:hypothetical protein